MLYKDPTAMGGGAPESFKLTFTESFVLTDT